MSAENETIADISAELRQDYKGRPPINRAETTWCRRLIADRIDAAYKREVEKLNSVIQATVSRSDAEIEHLRREVAELRKQIGNAAKLREAIAKCVSLITEFGNAEIVNTPLDVIVDIEAILKAATGELVHSYDSDGDGPDRADLDALRFPGKGGANG